MQQLQWCDRPMSWQSLVKLGPRSLRKLCQFCPTL